MRDEWKIVLAGAPVLVVGVALHASRRDAGDPAHRLLNAVNRPGLSGVSTPGVGQPASRPGHRRASSAVRGGLAYAAASTLSAAASTASRVEDGEQTQLRTAFATRSAPELERLTCWLANVTPGLTGGGRGGLATRGGRGPRRRAEEAGLGRDRLLVKFRIDTPNFHT